MSMYMPPKPQFTHKVTKKPHTQNTQNTHKAARTVLPTVMLKLQVALENSGSTNWLNTPVPIPVAPTAIAAAVLPLRPMPKGSPVLENGVVVIEPPALAPPQTMPSEDVYIVVRRHVGIAV